MEVKEWRDEQFIKAIRQNRAGMFRVARMMLRMTATRKKRLPMLR